MGDELARLVNNLYTLVLDDDRAGVARIIEFEAPGAQAALFIADRHCRGRTAEVFENGRSLGRITSEAADGFWVITAPATRSYGAAIG